MFLFILCVFSLFLLLSPVIFGTGMNIATVKQSSWECSITGHTHIARTLWLAWIKYRNKNNILYKTFKHFQMRHCECTLCTQFQSFKHRRSWNFDLYHGTTIRLISVCVFVCVWVCVLCFRVLHLCSAGHSISLHGCDQHIVPFGIGEVRK